MALLIEILVFLVVIVVLILVHEIGHFIVAKLSGMRVDEFGIGYPPRALRIGKIGETEYTLNWLPFGGFVRIYGEDATEPIVESRAFSSKPRILQALVLVAGVAMNVLLAYLLITATLTLGTEQILSYGHEGSAKNVSLEFAEVLPGSPAAVAGFQVGDQIKSALAMMPTIGLSYSGTNPLGLITLIGSDSTLSPVVFTVDRNGKTLTITATPKLNVIANSPKQPAIGVAIVEAGVVKTPLPNAFIQAGPDTWNMVKETFTGLYGFFKGIFILKPDFSQVSGPIGIAGIVGQATASGLVALLSLTALISINLAIINLLPIPALDGGRLLFVIIEAIIRRPINPKVAMRVNMIGFALLILLMVAVSAHDIYKLF